MCDYKYKTLVTFLAWQNWVATSLYGVKTGREQAISRHSHWNTLPNATSFISFHMRFYQACLCDCAGGPGVSWQDRGVSRQGWIRPLRCEYSAAAPAWFYCFYMLSLFLRLYYGLIMLLVHFKRWYNDVNTPSMLLMCLLSFQSSYSGTPCPTHMTYLFHTKKQSNKQSRNNTTKSFEVKLY